MSCFLLSFLIAISVSYLPKAGKAGKAVLYDSFRIKKLRAAAIVGLSLKNFIIISLDNFICSIVFLVLLSVIIFLTSFVYEFICASLILYS